MDQHAGPDAHLTGQPEAALGCVAAVGYPVLPLGDVSFAATAEREGEGNRPHGFALKVLPTLTVLLCWGVTRTKSFSYEHVACLCREALLAQLTAGVFPVEVGVSYGAILKEE